MTDNETKLSKQASKYSDHCGLVILFNYQNMIVLDFTPGPSNACWNNRTSPVRYYFSDGQTMTHKKLLIAALIYGMRKADIMGTSGEVLFI